MEKAKAKKGFWWLIFKNSLISVEVIFYFIFFVGDEGLFVFFLLFLSFCFVSFFFTPFCRILLERFMFKGKNVAIEQMR